MPQIQHRRVRVLDSIANMVPNLVQLPLPQGLRTSSPTGCESTASSLTPPRTPQSLFKTIPLPALIPYIHPAITYTGAPPCIAFDFAFPPSRLPAPNTPFTGSDRSFGPSHPIQSIDLALLPEPATYPDVPSIILQTKALPWSITVTAGSTFVTLYDVLEALHSSLRLQVTPTEWASLSRGSQDMILASFLERVDGFSDHIKREKQLEKGVRRLDFLVGRTRFFGISPIAGKPDVYRVHWRIGRRPD